MKIFGLDISRAKATARSGAGGWELRSSDGQGAWSPYYSSYIPRKINGMFYEIMRESIPIIDAAINRLTNLDGYPKIEGDNGKLVAELEDFWYNVPVNDVETGIQALHRSFTSEAHEQGFSLFEEIYDKKRTDIIGFRVADSKSIKFQRNPEGLKMFQKADGDPIERELKQASIYYFGINNENQNPYGVALMRGCETVSKALLTIHTSLERVWKRFGDPSFEIVYKTTKRDDSDFETRRKKISEEFNAALRAKEHGHSADFVRVLGKDSDITIKVIGADGQILEAEMPSRLLVEQLVSRTGLTPPMLGLYWSAGAGIGEADAELILGDSKVRQFAKGPHFYNITRRLLQLRGRTSKPGDWKLTWVQPNLHDMEKEARARFMNTQADYYIAQISSTAATPPASTPSKGAKECGCGGHKHIETIKELQRPTPWPELDKIEADYEDTLKNAWAVLQDKVFTVLKLNALGKSQKDDIPTMDNFTFTEEQRQSIFEALKNMTGTFRIDDVNSPVLWYYGQSYSLGLIQAVKLISKDRPILDIIKNKEIYDELCNSGFTLVKDNATKVILNRILPEMEAQMIAGTNPRHVADRLEKLFGDQNSDWERLARSEMSMVAEKAKLDEWSAWKVKMVEFTPAPDACPLCLSLAGVYPIDKCPIPVKDTHPRDRCSIRPAASEVEGKSATVNTQDNNADEMTKQMTALADQVRQVSEAMPGMITDIAGRMKTEIIMPAITFPDIKMPDVHVTIPDITVTTPPVNVTTPDVKVYIEHKDNAGKKVLSIQKDEKGRIIGGAIEEIKDGE